MNKWIFKGENGSRATLAFDSGKACFEVYDNNELKAKISGEYIIDENEITITDVSLPAVFKFEYQLDGAKAIISFDGEKIEMTRDKSD